MFQELAIIFPSIFTDDASVNCYLLVVSRSRGDEFGHRVHTEYADFKSKFSRGGLHEKQNCPIGAQEFEFVSFGEEKVARPEGGSLVREERLFNASYTRARQISLPRNPVILFDRTLHLTDWKPSQRGNTTKFLPDTRHEFPVQKGK